MPENKASGLAGRGHWPLLASRLQTYERLLGSIVQPLDRGRLLDPALLLAGRDFNTTYTGCLNGVKMLNEVLETVLGL